MHILFRLKDLIALHFVLIFKSVKKKKIPTWHSVTVDSRKIEDIKISWNIITVPFFLRI